MINVLIADDDPNARAGLTEMLDWHALDANLVAAVEDGEKVIELLKQHSGIDLIILDICMPHMDGLAVSKYIRDNNLSADIILLSAHAEFEYAREALRYGVREYIIKPINRAKLNQLVEAIKAVCMDRQQTTNWRQFLYSSQRHDDITLALNSANVSSLDAILNIEEEFGNVTVKDFRDYCFKLLDYLRESVKAKGKNTDICERTIKLLRDIPDIKSMKTLFKECFKAIISLDSAGSGKAVSGVVVIAKEYINSNILSSDLHSSAVANHLKLSVDHLSRLFKAAGEESLSDYIITAKMDKAKEIIANTSNPIRQVAQILGYSDPGYFVRVFKKKTGVTPTEYRTQCREAPR